VATFEDCNSFKVESIKSYQHHHTKKQKKTLTGGTLSMSSTKSITSHTEQSSDKDSSSQLTVVNIDSDEEVENPEEDPDVENGKVMA